VNKAVSEMDKVVQQNAANAEESASASEQMNAQAESIKAMDLCPSPCALPSAVICYF
jgi:hypothetical protein